MVFLVVPVSRLAFHLDYSSNCFMLKCLSNTVLYGTELWKLKCSQETDFIQIQASKKLLNVSKNISNVAILGDLRSFPKHLIVAKRFIKYWLRTSILSMAYNS